MERLGLERIERVNFEVRGQERERKYLGWRKVGGKIARSTKGVEEGSVEWMVRSQNRGDGRLQESSVGVSSFLLQYGLVIRYLGK